VNSLKAAVKAMVTVGGKPNKKRETQKANRFKKKTTRQATVIWFVIYKKLLLIYLQYP